ncbi:SMI1/KNR4 family protein [Pseudomonas congelans]|uniref:SMI1/KNR4 family protein n=1 Tax=Pseudomonas congelans TaxID=200452 RepID=UPI0020290323|nr:SMI1/KNR4 family protein [Pseudomonas congelans]
MMIFKLENPGSSITKSDISELEKIIEYALPHAFIDLYLSHNGGRPNREWWDSSNDYEPISISTFKKIAQTGSVDKKETQYIGGCYALMITKHVIPQNMVPFASDQGGNFFCLDKNTGWVIFYTTDSFQPELAMALNHINAQRKLASSFGEFISGLKSEDEIDL